MVENAEFCSSHSDAQDLCDTTIPGVRHVQRTGSQTQTRCSPSAVFDPLALRVGSIVTGHDSRRGGDGEPDVTLRFDHDYGAPKAARSAIKGLLDDPEDPIGDDVELATSELVTNVVVHTDHGGELRAWDPQPDVPMTIEVEDSDDHVPAPLATPPAVGGRGLHIVEEVADAWGVESLDGTGKIVWAEFDRDEHAPL